MRVLLLLLCLSSALSLADVGPRPPPCVVPSECVTCTHRIGDADDGCAAAAVDAGLVEAECWDRRGAMASAYYCPAGKTAVSGGWLVGGALGLGLAALAAGIAWWRRRRPR